MHPFKTLEKPIIEFGAPIPGKRTVKNGLPRWEGELCWEAIHGDAMSLWVAGSLAGVYNASTPDGHRTKELKPGDPETSGWRRERRGKMIHGSVKLLNDDIVFIDNEAQPSNKRWAAGSLPSYLLSSGDALEAVRDFGFAADLYGALCSLGWVHRTGKQYRGSWSRAAEIVAQMRGHGEIGIDFYLNGNEGYVTEEVTDLMEAIGWSRVDRADNADLLAGRAATLVSLCEQRPIAAMPDWYAQWITGLRDDDDLDARLHRAAFAGKVSFSEWLKFWEMFDFPE